MAATNSDLNQLVAEGKFREDLLYRINTVELHIPPLSDRKQDIPLLVNHFLKIYCQKYRKGHMTVQKQAIVHLEQHDWPGNVRELQHAVERAVIMAEDSVLRKSDFLLSKRSGSRTPASFNITEMERHTIEKAIAKHHGNISKASEELGMGRTTLYRKMEKYGIK